VLGSFEIDRQARLPPMSGRVATAVLKIDDIEKRRILASSVELTGLPVSGSAMREARARHERIAQKYDVALPKRYRPFAPDHNRYFVSAIPWIIGGLENYEEHEVRVVKPFAWPVQPEEWHLDHWLSAGYTVFLISHEQDLLRSTVAVYRQLHQGIAQRCTAIDALRGDKTLFFEGEVKIYRCDRAQKNAS
jgi:hypothetical protein